MKLTILYSNIGFSWQKQLAEAEAKSPVRAHL